MSGKVFSIWGPTGSPGRTTIAVNLAATCAAQGKKVFLIDADTYAASVAYSFGNTEESSGIAALCRLAEMDALDSAQLAKYSHHIPTPTGALSIISGITRAERWPELAMEKMAKVISFVATQCDVVVIDVGFNLEADEEISSDLFAPRRNAATIASLHNSEVIVEVTGSDPVSLSRFIRAHQILKENFSGKTLVTVVNKLESTSTWKPHTQSIFASLSRFAGIHNIHPIRLDRPAMDKAQSAQTPLVLSSGRSGITSDFTALATQLLALESYAQVIA